jgi:hypothetical protein
MQAIHFTPGTLDPENVRRHGTVAHMPLASGNGEFEVSCLYVAPGGSIAVEPKRHPQLLLVVGLALRGRQQLDLSAHHIALMYTECSVVMLPCRPWCFRGDSSRV